MENLKVKKKTKDRLSKMGLKMILESIEVV